MMNLIDCHVHLQDPIFRQDLPDVLARSYQAGITHLICNGSAENDWPDVHDLAIRNALVVPCFGLHPWYVRERSPNWLNELERKLDSIPSAIGEIGLDRWIENPDIAGQEETFRVQLRLARQRNMPVSIHCLQAWGWLLDIMKMEGPFPAGFLVHAYGGSAELIGPLSDVGGYFSFAGSVLYDRKVKARESLAQVSLDRLLIETDAPDLPPPKAFRQYGIPRPGGTVRNEPANLPRILEGIACLRDQDAGVLARQTCLNARRLFGNLIQ